MRNPNCKFFDFRYTTYEGEQRIYCAARPGAVRPRDCRDCGLRVARPKPAKAEQGESEVAR